jgi:hypothetical protein
MNPDPQIHNIAAFVVKRFRIRCRNYKPALPCHLSEPPRGPPASTNIKTSRPPPRPLFCISSPHENRIHCKYPEDLFPVFWGYSPVSDNFLVFVFIHVPTIYNTDLLEELSLKGVQVVRFSIARIFKIFTLYIPYGGRRGDFGVKIIF